MDSVEIAVRGDPDWTRAWVESTLRSAGFRVRWDGPGKARAVRGDRIDGWLFGPRSRWLRLAVQVVPTSATQTTVAVERVGPTSGPKRDWGPAMAEIAERLWVAFRDNGRLVSTTGS